MAKINTFKKLDIPSQLMNTIFILLLILTIAPYVGGIDIGIAKIPTFPKEISWHLRWLSPLLLLAFCLMFCPAWKAEGNEDENRASTSDQPTRIHPGSKYILQSTPEIILNEIQKSGYNIDGINIVRGFNINDLIKRLTILNPAIEAGRLSECVRLAREVAFTSKYADPREDEKLVSIADIGIHQLKGWESYLIEFLEELGISKLRDLNALDVGIGNARASYPFLKEFHSLIGVDVSKKALEYAQGELPRASLLVSSAEDLKEVESFSIDLYVSLRTYQSTLFDIKQAIHEAYRVLARGGGIVISIPVMYLVKRDDGSVKGVVKGLIPSGSKEPSLEYAHEIAVRICWYLELLGFHDFQICEDSPFEIFIGARK